jgi:hypothetical protein
MSWNSAAALANGMLMRIEIEWLDYAGFDLVGDAF